MAGGAGGNRGTKSAGGSQWMRSPSKSVDVSSPSPLRFVCTKSNPCQHCQIHRSSHRGVSGGSCCGGDGGSSPSGDSESKSQAKSTSSESTGSESDEFVRGIETKAWGGLDQETDARCDHGKRPRRLLCWNGKNTGRRCLACPLNGDKMCDFV
ncbi:unnamed protein product [Urochloa humidicola]